MAPPVTGSRHPKFLPIAALLAAIVLCRPAAAQPQGQEFWRMPDGLVAFVAFDPQTLGAKPDPTCLLYQAGLRALIENIADVEGGGLPFPADLLTPAVLGASAYKVCLIELESELPATTLVPDRPLRLTGLKLIVEIRAKGPHDTLIEVIRSAVSKDHTARRAPAASETVLDLANGRRATILATTGEPEWREVSWSSTPDALLVGLGHGAIEQWLALPVPRADPKSEWTLIRSDIQRRRRTHLSILDAGVDLDALRRTIPQEFAAGRLGRLVQALHISNARVVSLSARLQRLEKDADAVPLLYMDAGWSARSEPPGTVHSIPLTESDWPEAIDLPRPTRAAGYATVVKAAWSEWVPLALDSWIALTHRSNTGPLVAKLKWMRAHSRALDRLTDRAGPWVQLCGPDPAVAPFLTAFDNPPATGDTLDADLREVFGFLSNSIKAEPAKRLWTLRLGDCDPPLDQFGWIAPKQSRLFMGSWDPASFNGTRPDR